MDKIRVPAPAKINLALDIKGLRPDGFHELEMIMQSISLHDIIDIKKTPGSINIDTSEESLSNGRDNLAYQAADLILNKANVAGGVDIFINKKIPLAAGLAGGSTDAAAVLKGINKLYSLKLPLSEMKKLAAAVGSDVPFCLGGGTAYATGRGTEIKQLPDINKQILIIVCPPVKISTAEIYNDYDKLINKKEFPYIPINKLLDIIKSSLKIKWDEGWNNILEPVTINKCTKIKTIKCILLQKGVKFCLMSGSGPAVFAVVNSREKANHIVNTWPRQGDLIFTACTVRKNYLELWQ